MNQYQKLNQNEEVKALQKNEDHLLQSTIIDHKLDEIDQFIHDSSLGILQLQKNPKYHINHINSKLDEVLKNNQNVPISQFAFKSLNKSQLIFQDKISSPTKSNKSKFQKGDITPITPRLQNIDSKLEQKLYFKQLVNQADSNIRSQSPNSRFQNFLKVKKVILPNMLHNSIENVRYFSPIEKGRGEKVYQNRNKKQENHDHTQNQLIKAHLMIKVYQETLKSNLKDDTKIVILKEIWKILNINAQTLQSHFEQLEQEIDQFIFVDDTKYELFSEIIGMKKDKNKNITYKELFQSLSTKITEWKNNLDSLVQKNKSENHHKDLQIQNLNKQIATHIQNFNEQSKQQAAMIQQIEANCQNIIQEKSREVDKINRILSDIKEQTIKMQENFENDRNQLVQTYEQLVKESNIKIYELKQRVHDLELNQDIITSQYEKIKDAFSSSFIQVKLTSNQIKQKNEQIQEIYTEVETLKQRAAVAFDELTPRPNLNYIQQVLGIKIEEKKRLSTVFKIQRIYQELQKFSHQKTVEKIPQKIEEVNEEKPKNWNKIKRASKIINIRERAITNN